MPTNIDDKEPGLTLARARREKNLSLDDVADRLHLSSHQIRLLEENNYDELPEATYVKGYIRNYAKFVDLDPLPLIAAFTEKSSPKKHDTVETISPKQPEQKSNNESRAMYSIVGIIVLVVAVIAIWIGSQGNVKQTAETTAKPVQNNELQAQSRENLEPQDGINMPDDAKDGTTPELTPAKVEQEPQYPAVPAMKKAEVEEVNKPAIQKQISSAVQKEPSTPQVPGVNSGAVVNQARIEDKQTSTTVVQKTVKPQQLDELVLFFEQNSWADVRDVNDNKLLYKTINEGRVVSVKGEAPFKVFLGNAQGVKLSYNGKQVDFEKYKRGLIARFTVGRK